MKPPTPGLKRLRYDARRPSKTTVHVPPGDELEVSAEVAKQLQAADSHFKDVDDTAEDEPDDDLCAGTTAAGDPCSKKAGDGGFCHLHGPEEGDS